MTVLLTLIALVLAYVVGQVHLVYIIRTEFPGTWLILQAERALNFHQGKDKRPDGTKGGQNLE